MFDIDAPIIPGKALGNIELRAHIKEHYNLIKTFTRIDRNTLEYRHAILLTPFHIGYELEDTFRLVFHVMNSKLQKITALNKYKGKFNTKIQVGMLISEALELEKDMYFDDDEELYFIHGKKGISIESDVENDYIQAINVYISELDDFKNDTKKWENMERGDW